MYHDHHNSEAEAHHTDTHISNIHHMHGETLQLPGVYNIKLCTSYNAASTFIIQGASKVHRHGNCFHCFHW